MKNYNVAFLRSDILGGISVAALSIPVGVAYSEIAGLPPESGLYTAIIALIAYFILGSSKQVIIGPDSATVTLFATTIFALSAGNSSLTPQFIMMVTALTGVLMFLAGFLKLGFISNFLSKPILIGYLNGISIVLIVSQLGKLTGIQLTHTGIFLKVFEVFENVAVLHWPTFILGIASIVFLYLVKKISVKIPSQLLLLILTALVAALFNFKSLGIQFMQEIENPYPALILPDFKLFFAHFSEIFVASAAVLFVSFSGEIPVVQAFAKDKKGFNPNKEFFALGLADLVIGFFKGYPISGADSRTAVNVAVGGKTKIVNLVAALIMLLVILLIPGVFARIPLVTFGAIIVFAAMSMFKRGAGFSIYSVDKKEFLVFIVCILGVLLLGVYQGILFALVLSFIQLISKTSKPVEFELFFDINTESTYEYIPGSPVPASPEILIYRFDSALLFFNSNYFSEMITKRAASKPDLKLIVIDAKPVNLIDLTSLEVLGNLIKDFNERNITVVFSGANSIFKSSVVKKLEKDKIAHDIFYPGLHAVYMKFQSNK
jgi:high affinity sulfate transporter 1